MAFTVIFDPGECWNVENVNVTVINIIGEAATLYTQLRGQLWLRSLNGGKADRGRRCTL